MPEIKQKPQFAKELSPSEWEKVLKIAAKHKDLDFVDDKDHHLTKTKDLRAVKTAGKKKK
jgi:hypothetical protein